MANFIKMSWTAVLLMLTASMSLESQMVFAEQQDEYAPVIALDQYETSAAKETSTQPAEIKPDKSEMSNLADQADTAHVEIAEEAVVINAQTIGDQPDASMSDVSAPTLTDAPAESPADADSAPIHKGGRMSLRQKVAMDKAILSKLNRQQGDDFLAVNKARQDVITLPSGVQYKVLKANAGKNPTENSVVACRYRGTLTDETEFDKHDTKQPVALNVKGLLPGLKEAIKLMTAGSKWQIVVPPQLAYGDRGNRGVGPNAVLIYDMEIIAIN